MLIGAIHVVTPVDFVNLAGSSAGGGSLEVTREREHGDVAGFLIEADNHNRIGELGAVVSAVAFVAFHVITTGAES